MGPFSGIAVAAVPGMFSSTAVTAGFCFSFLYSQPYQLDVCTLPAPLPGTITTRTDCKAMAPSQLLTNAAGKGPRPCYVTVRSRSAHTHTLLSLNRRYSHMVCRMCRIEQLKLL